MPRPRRARRPRRDARRGAPRGVNDRLEPYATGPRLAAFRATRGSTITPIVALLAAGEGELVTTRGHVFQVTATLPKTKLPSAEAVLCAIGAHARDGDGAASSATPAASALPSVSGPPTRLA